MTSISYSTQAQKVYIHSSSVLCCVVLCCIVSCCLLVFFDFVYCCVVLYCVVLYCMVYYLNEHNIKQEAQSVRCLQWLLSLIDISDSLLRLITRALLNPITTGEISDARHNATQHINRRITHPFERVDFAKESELNGVLCDVLYYNTLMPKGFVEAVHDLTLRALVDEKFKISFGVLYSHALSSIVLQFNNDFGTYLLCCVVLCFMS